MELNNRKKDIKKELISDDLNRLLKVLVIFLLMAGLFGYIGYIYSKDNNLSISHGIIFGIIFPLGVGLLEAFDFNSFFSFIIYAFLYILITSYIPTFIGAIILFIIIGIFIIDFIYIERKDRTREIEEYYNKNSMNTVQDDNKKIEDLIREYDTIKDSKSLFDNTDENTSNEDDKEFECEMCFKKISEEEYELYDCMCEECFMDLHIDKDGNFHDDEIF